MTRTATLLTADDHAALVRAHARLEHPTFAARLGSVLGAPVEQALKLLPDSWALRIQAASEAAIARALSAAVASLGDEPAASGRDRLHKVLAIAGGAASGYFGLPALVVELPLTTVLMLRAIAEVARRHGEDLSQLEGRLACLEVFAFGGRSHTVTDAEIGYYEVRAVLAFHFSAVAQRVASQRGFDESLPTSIAVIRAVAARFGLVISDKASAQMVPIIGAATGALINALFVQHFQDVADGHFTVRRLERVYGADVVARAYDRLDAEAAAAAATAAA